MRRLLVVGACAAVLALGGCGGDGEDSTSTSSSTTQAGATAPEPSRQSTTGKGEGKAKQDDGSAGEGGEEGPGSSPRGASPVKVPPISSAPVAGSSAPAPGVKTVQGADNSVQTYGVEADEAARTEAAIALQAFLDARLREDWGGVCSYLAQKAREVLEKFAQGARGKDLSGCAETIAVLDKGTSRSQLSREATITEVLSFRGEGDVPGDPSYLIFVGPPGSTLYSMPMYLEGGGWKVGLALPSELPV